MSHAFLSGLEETGCVGPGTGWTPCHVTLWQENELTGAMPLYLKQHSYGEYVFDWAWANAYHQAGLAYYPKLISAVPFSPITGPRLLARGDAEKSAMLTTALGLAQETGASSLHVLFPDSCDLECLTRHDFLIREGVQFHWSNRDFRTFDDYLAAMTHKKRKKIKQERRKAADAGLVFRRVTGKDISDHDWAFFHRCYTETYRAHGSHPYLNQAFFQTLGDRLPDNVLMIIAYDGQRPIAASLNILSGNRLYGRYWGTLVHFDSLHFEACYYQAIEFCIEHGIQIFEGGAQGEHKLARGFLPNPTYSAHWLANAEFADAVDRFLTRERAGMHHYTDELKAHSPFRCPSGSDENAGT